MVESLTVLVELLIVLVELLTVFVEFIDFNGVYKYVDGDGDD